MQRTEQWEMVELTFQGKEEGNPFTDYKIYVELVNEGDRKVICGFYDGGGIYKVRFMCCKTGIYHYRVYGSFSDMQYEGEIEAVAPADKNNHGMVKTVEQYYLAYSDGTPHYSFGTTCYAWMYQPEELQEQTLKTLSDGIFNKLRFCIFPKFYPFNEREPKIYPYKRGKRRGIDEERIKRAITIQFSAEREKKDITDFDCFQFNPELFRKFDRRIAQLCDMGIEADIILMHPYDKWGFSNMTRECDRLYIEYVVARYAAYRNVWWSMANEYDMMTKTEVEWDELGELVKKNDPYGHMLSIHNCREFYDYRKEWITHCSMQRNNLYQCAELTDTYMKQYGKPVVWDEISYEGNMPQGWGNISGEELVRRFWEAFLRGGAAGHGETYEGETIWWSHGGALYGTSAPRIGFLRKIMEETPGTYLKYTKRAFDEIVGIPYRTEVREEWTYFAPVKYADYEIHYYGFCRPSRREFHLPENECFRFEIIDTWNMTITDAGVHSGYTKIRPPGREYMAIRIKREDAGSKN